MPMYGFSNEPYTEIRGRAGTQLPPIEKIKQTTGWIDKQQQQYQ